MRNKRNRVGGRNRRACLDELGSNCSAACPQETGCNIAQRSCQPGRRTLLANIEPSAYSWAGPVVNTRVSYRLAPDGAGTRVFFEHSGFDLSEPWGELAFKRAEFGWMKILDQLSDVVAGRAAGR
jgi:hypothetical protein